MVVSRRPRSRRRSGEWLWHARVGVLFLAKNQPKHLVDRITDTPRSGMALRFRVFATWMRQPSFDERLNVGGKLIPAIRASPMRKLSESDQQRHANEDIPRGVLLPDEPHDVTLDRVANPRCTDSINSGWTNEITVQHENLLSPRGGQEMIARSVPCYVPSRMGESSNFTRNASGSAT